MKTLPLPIDPKKILIVKPSSLGDIIHSLPLLSAVKTTFPRAEIHWVVARGFHPLLEGHPLIDRLWIIDKDKWKVPANILGTISDLRRLSRDLKKEAYDAAIDLQGLLRSGFLTGATCAPIRIGFEEAKEGSVWFYTHTVQGGRQIHAVDRYLKIAAALGCDIANVSFPLVPTSDTETTRRIKAEAGSYAVIVPGARKEANRWPAVRFGELASRLAVPTLIVGGAADAKLAEEIVSLSNGKASSIVGATDLRELMSILREAEFVISNDTGPMHIAAAYGVPVVAIFGPANPVRTGPYGKQHIIVKADIPCAPCYKKQCKDRRCMDMITVDRVYEAVSLIIKGRENRD